MRKANYVAPGQKWTTSNPCPNCGRTGTGTKPHCHGFEADNDFLYCTSDEHANGALYKGQMVPPAYLHKRERDGSIRPWTATPTPTPINAARRAHTAPPKAHTSEPGTRYFTYTDRQRVRRTDAPGKEKIILPEHLINGQWHTGEGSGEIEYIYRRAEAAEHPDRPLDIFEGETCAEAGAALGLRTIAWRGGTGRVSQAIEQIKEVAAGQHVRLHRDSDQPGRKAMQKIAAAIAPVVASVKLVDYHPDEHPESGGRDIQDWLAEGGNADDLMQLIADAPEYEQDDEDDEPAPRSAWDHFKERAVNLADIIENGIDPVEPFDAEEPDLLVGCVTCIIGGPEQGKTVLAAHKIIRALRADKRVLLIDEEMGTRLTAERLDAMGATRDDLSRLIYFPFTLADFGGNLDEMAETITEGIIREQIDLIVMDSVSKLIAAAGMDENSNSDATRLLGAWITPAAHVHGRTVLLLDHTTKVEDDGKYGRGAGSKLADVDVQFHIQAAVPPTRTSMGRLVLTRKKDRLSSVPASVNYLAGGDGTGAFNVRIEGSDATTAVKVRESDRAALLALYGEHNTPLRFAEWQAALKRTKSTFTDSRRRLVNARLVEQRDDFYQVSTLGIEAIKDDLDITPKQPPLTEEKNAKIQKSGTVTTSPDDPDHDPTRAQTKPRHDTLGTDAPKTNEPIHGKENAVGTARYGVGTDVPLRTSQTEGGKEGTEGTAPLKGPYLPYLPPDAPDFDEDEAFDRALRVEPEAEDAAAIAMWQWICDLHVGRVDDAPEEIRQAAQQAGFAIDPFAPVLAEAARLERFLDAERPS